MMAKRAIGVAVCTAALLGAGTTAASAGEITGNGKSLQPLHAKSWCAFSGLDDADDDGFGRTQNWGQIPKEFRDFLTSIGESPGVACNAHLNPYEAGGEH